MLKKSKFITLGIIFLILITITGAIANGLYQGISTGIKTPKYSIEGLDTNIKFYIWNKGNVTFNGTVIYDFSGEKISWEEKQQNITIHPNNYTLIVTSMNPSYPGLYWTNIKIKDDKDRQIYQTQDAFNVHSYSETATIIGVIIAFLSFIMYLIFKKK